MKYLLFVPLLLIGAAAVWFDLSTGRIPNALILAGLAAALGWQLAAHGISGLLFFAAGAAIPVLLLWLLFYFRMLGAGDIKLLGAVGGFLGPGKILLCMFWAFLAAGACSLILLAIRRNLWERLLYFGTYVWNLASTRQWEPYIQAEDEGGHLHFSVPVLVSILFYVGGVY